MVASLILPPRSSYERSGLRAVTFVILLVPPHDLERGGAGLQQIRAVPALALQRLVELGERGGRLHEVRRRRGHRAAPGATGDGAALQADHRHEERDHARMIIASLRTA